MSLRNRPGDSDYEDRSENLEFAYNANLSAALEMARDIKFLSRAQVDMIKLKEGLEIDFFIEF